MFDILIEEASKLINSYSEANSLYDFQQSNEIFSLKHSENIREVKKFILFK